MLQSHTRSPAAAALATGNAVVHKPDPRTPISGGIIIARVFEEAGLPKDLLHIIPGGGEAGTALCEDPNIAMVSFTGSPGVGAKVGEACGRNLKKVQLELGGKNALIIQDDADFALAAANAAWGTWLHQGQICMATGLILAPAAMADALAAELAAKAGVPRATLASMEQAGSNPGILAVQAVARALGMEPPETDSQSGAAKRKRKVPASELSPVVGVHFSNFIIQ
jgi:benzaldehyde dehydrogenase (NAD)